MSRGKFCRVYTGASEGWSNRRQPGPLSVVQNQQGAGRGGNLGRQLNAEALKQGDEIAAPSDGHGCGADRILDDQVPSNDPGKNFAQRGIAVGVGGAGDWNE